MLRQPEVITEIRFNPETPILNRVGFYSDGFWAALGLGLDLSFAGASVGFALAGAGALEDLFA